LGSWPADAPQLLKQMGCGKADYIITGIPFKTIPEEVRQGIMRATSSALQPNGTCLVYSFSSRVQPYLERNFGRVRRDYEWLNFLPGNSGAALIQTGIAGMMTGSPGRRLNSK
jgi:phospholipid N-methyltransferase